MDMKEVITIKLLRHSMSNFSLLRMIKKISKTVITLHIIIFFIGCASGINTYKTLENPFDAAFKYKEISRNDDSAVFQIIPIDRHDYTSLSISSLLEVYSAKMAILNGYQYMYIMKLQDVNSVGVICYKNKPNSLPVQDAKIIVEGFNKGYNKNQ